MKNHTSWQENRCPRKKSEWKVCLLFWLEICSIICAYFIPIIVLKFQLKITVKIRAKTIGFLSLIFFVFLLYSKAILGFSLSLSLFLCIFHCFNCWIILENILLKLHWFSFHFIFFLSLVIACHFVSLFVSGHIGNWKGGLVSSLEEFESRSNGPTTLRATGLRSTPNLVNHKRKNNHQNWGPLL